MTKKIKVFEALIGNEWKSWKAGDGSIVKTGSKITITNNVKSDNFTGSLVTTFDLTKLIAHSIGR